MNLFRWFLQCGYIYIGYEDVRSVHPFYTSYQAQVCMPWLQSFQNRRAGEKIFNSFLIIHVICYTLLYIQIIPERANRSFEDSSPSSGIALYCLFLKRFLKLSKRDFFSALSALKLSHSLNFTTRSFSSLVREVGMKTVILTIISPRP